MKTLIQSEIFEQKLSQVVSDSVCPSSQLYGEQCKMVVLTLINPGTLVKIINEVSGLLKNVNVGIVNFICLKKRRTLNLYNV